MVEGTGFRVDGQQPRAHHHYGVWCVIAPRFGKRGSYPYCRAWAFESPNVEQICFLGILASNMICSYCSSQAPWFPCLGTADRTE